MEHGLELAHPPAGRTSGKKGGVASVPLVPAGAARAVRSTALPSDCTRQRDSKMSRGTNPSRFLEHSPPLSYVSSWSDPTLDPRTHQKRSSFPPLMSPPPGDSILRFTGPHPASSNGSKPISRSCQSRLRFAPFDLGSFCSVIYLFEIAVSPPYFAKISLFMLIIVFSINCISAFTSGSSWVCPSAICFVCSTPPLPCSTVSAPSRSVLCRQSPSRLTTT